MSEKIPNLLNKKEHIERSLADEGIINAEKWRDTLSPPANENEWTERLIATGEASDVEAAKAIQNEIVDRLYRALNSDVNNADALLRSDEIFLPPSLLQKAVKISFIKNIYEGKTDLALRIIDHPTFLPDSSFYNSLSVRNALTELLDKSLSNLDIETFDLISNNPRLAPDKDCLKNISVQKKLAFKLYDCISEGDFASLEKAKNYFGEVVDTILSDQEQVQIAIGDDLRNAYYNHRDKEEIENIIRAGLAIENETLEETRKLLFNMFLSAGSFREANRYADTQDLLVSNSIQDLYKEAIIKEFNRGDIDDLNYLLSEPTFKISKDTEYEAIETGIINSFQGAPCASDTLPKYLELLFKNIETKKAESIIDKGLIEYIKTRPTSKKDFTDLLAAINHSPSNSFYKSTDLKSAIKKNIQKFIGDIAEDNETSDTDSMSEPISDSQEEDYDDQEKTNENTQRDFFENRKYYWPNKDFFQEDYDESMDVIEFNDEDDYHDYPEYSNYNDDYDFDHNEEDNDYSAKNLEYVTSLLSIISSQKLSDVIPELTGKKNEILKLLEASGNISKKEAISFSNVVDASLSAQLFIYQEKTEKIVQTIRETPFLLKAISNNESFGMRLFSAYEGFDDTSKEKINLLFKHQEEILDEDPSIPKNSTRFRVAMQNKLKEYDKNSEILEEVERFGIDTEAWLGHDETVDFILGGDGLEEKNPISKMIEKPFDRIIMKTIPEFFKIIKEEIAAYADDLKKIRIVDRIKKKELEEKLSRMKELYESETDPNKKKGIQKGIASLESALNNLKTIAYSDKYNGAISGIFNIIDKYKPKTKKQPEKQDSEEIGFIEQIRQCENAGDFQKANQLKKLFHSDHRLLVSRFDSFQKEFNEVIKAHLGGHGEAILQSVHHRTAELLSHLETDNQDLGKVLEDLSLDEKLKQIKSVSLELWNRNPDIDLYLGNYSPCCISIEGGAGWDSSESAIADYMTDLSIQVLNLRDKNKKIPIMSAWLYLGKSGDGKTSSLVIDNIESDSNETSLHEVEIWNAVADYIIRYAHKISVDKVSMGESNNDVAPYLRTHDDQEYEKIGYSNGQREQGYYLESEDQEVLLIWKNDRFDPDFREEAFKNLDESEIDNDDTDNDYDEDYRDYLNEQY